MPKRYLSEDTKGQTGDKEAVEVGEKIPLDWQDRGEELPAMMIMMMIVMVVMVMVIVLVMLTMMRRRDRRRKKKEIRVLP